MTVRRQSLADPIHLMRYLKFQALSGTRVERITEIAKSESISPKQIISSIHRMEVYRATTDTSSMEAAVRDIVVSAAPKAKETLIGLMGATELVEITDPNTSKKKLVRQADKTARIEGVRLMNDLIGKMQPKGPLVEVNQNHTTQIANLSASETIEERLARLRKKAQEHNLLPPEVVAVPEHIDKGLETEDDDEEDDGEQDGDEEEG